MALLCCLFHYLRMRNANFPRTYCKYIGVEIIIFYLGQCNTNLIKSKRSLKVSYSSSNVEKLIYRKLIKMLSDSEIFPPLENSYSVISRT